MTADRPSFDEVHHGYHRDQVDAYIASLWRYASQATARAAEAEAKLARVDAYSSVPELPSHLAGAVGGRVGRILQLATEEAEAMRAAARMVAERALIDAVERAAAGGPVVREAHEQVDRLLMDAREEADRRSRRREQEADSRVDQAAEALEDLRQRQAEVLTGLARLREVLVGGEIEAAAARLARASADMPPAGEPSARRSGARFTPVEDDDIVDAEIVEDDYPND